MAHPSLDDLRNWNDGETVCPPSLVGDYEGLSEWCVDALSAVVGGRRIPDPEEYRTTPTAGIPDAPEGD